MAEATARGRAERCAPGLLGPAAASLRAAWACAGAAATSHCAAWWQEGPRGGSDCPFHDASCDHRAVAGRPFACLPPRLLAHAARRIQVRRSVSSCSVGCRQPQPQRACPPHRRATCAAHAAHAQRVPFPRVAQQPDTRPAQGLMLGASPLSRCMHAFTALLSWMVGPWSWVWRPVAVPAPAPEGGECPIVHVTRPDGEPWTLCVEGVPQ